MFLLGYQFFLIATQSDSVRGMSPMMSNTGPLSPESEVARKLGIIGDRVKYLAITFHIFRLTCCIS